MDRTLKVYNPPQVRDYGTVREVTQTSLLMLSGDPPMPLPPAEPRCGPAVGGRGSGWICS